jgi:hypothetical protein
MTITATTARVSFTCDGVITVFPVGIQAYYATDFKVVLSTPAGAQTTLTLNSDYTMASSGSLTPPLWTLTCTDAQPWAAGDVLQVILNPVETQTTVYAQGVAFPSAAVQANMDRLTQMAIRLSDSLARSVTAPDGDAGPSMLLPSAVNRAQKYAAFDVNGNLIATALPVISSAALTQANVGAALYPVLAGEAGVTNTAYPYGDVRRFGAVGNGVVDDTAAIQNCLNCSARVFFQPGLVWKISASLTVPTTCTIIDGLGSYLVGPGAATTVDGFVFSGFYNGSLSIVLASNRYRLPGVTHCRRAFSFVGAAFINVEADFCQFCTDGVHVDSTSVYLQFCVELDIDIKNISMCTNGFNMISWSGSSNGIQGCHFKSNYVNGCNVGIAGIFDTASAAFTFNYFDITVLDGNGAQGAAAAISYNLTPNASANFYRIPGDVINMTSSPAYVNVGGFSDFEILHFRGGRSADYVSWVNFSAVQPTPTIYPGNGTLYVNVATNGSDVTGTGSALLPYATVGKAIAMIQGLNLLGTNAVIQLAAGAYPAAITYDTTTANDPQCQMIIQPLSAAAVTLSGGITVYGAGAKVLLSNAAGTLTVSGTGLLVQYGALVNISGVTWGAVTGAHMTILNTANIVMNSNYSITGGATVHVATQRNGSFVCAGNTVTLVGNPAFSTEFSFSNLNGNQDWTGTTFTGAATGTRYQATLNGVVNTNGGGANFLPGNAAGSVANGGVYA